MQVTPREKPLLIYDGACQFCGRWIARWRKTSGDRVGYEPYQDVVTQFPQITLSDFASAVQFVDTDGTVYDAAEAVFRARACSPRRGALLWAYQRVPGFASTSEAVYRFVARRRDGFSKITRLLWGDTLEPSTFSVARRLFLRLLGVVYLMAFVSLLVQIRGLIGEDGILPVGQYLSAAHEQIGDAAYWRVPTLCWLGCSDAFLQWGLCGGGAVLSVLLILGLTPLPVLALLWLFYLSLTTAGQTFLSFQWDILLLEVGLVAILLAPATWRLSSPRAGEPSRVAHFLVKFLLFKLMFLSGVVKLNSGDDSWANLTALNFHYESQPLPSWTSWYVHQFPEQFQALSIAVVFVIELALPFLIFGPRRLRHFAAAGTVGFMLLIGATGNYNFFNLLTALLCVSLLDDAFLRRFMLRRRRGSSQPHPTPRSGFHIRNFVLIPIAVVILSFGIVQIIRGTTQHNIAPGWMRKTMRYAAPFRSVNSYGLFRVMTKSRPEIIIEGSDDGITWLEYEFIWKPGDVDRRPSFMQPHQPRLDWQMWFAALNRRRQWSWFRPMMQRIVEGSPEVLALLKTNPFPDQPPRYLRALLYNYRFTTIDERRESGAWWSRELRGLYAPRIARPEHQSDAVVGRPRRQQR